MVAPLRQGLWHEGPIEGMHVYPVILEPAANPPYDALHEHSSAVQIGVLRHAMEQRPARTRAPFLAHNH
jgi:hypothetical protein